MFKSSFWKKFTDNQIKLWQKFSIGVCQSSEPLKKFQSNFEKNQIELLKIKNKIFDNTNRAFKSKKALKIIQIQVELLKKILIKLNHELLE